MNTRINSGVAIEAEKFLSSLQPGNLPLTIFNEVARLSVTPVVEIVPLKIETNGKVKVLLLQRDANDPHWAGRLYVPGTIVLPSDSVGDLTDALHRIVRTKLGGIKASKPKFVGHTLCRVSRGTELALIYSIKIVGNPAIGAFYDAHNLPRNLIEGHAEFIRSALKKM